MIINIWNYIYFFIFSILVAFNLGCSSAIIKEDNLPNNPIISSLYCDGFMIYTMCAEDLTGDGKVDLFFFEDDDQIFFYREHFIKEAIGTHLFHPCMQKMNEELVEAGSKLFSPEIENDLLLRFSLQTKLMSFYIGYLPIITACMGEREEGSSNSDIFNATDEEYF